MLARAHADNHAAEFRGPGTHHHYDDSPDDFDMDMDQRTRFLGGRAGRIILLGDGTEIMTGNIHDDDGDVDMEDRGEAEEADDDSEDQVPASSQSKANGETADEDRSKREETPAPSLQGKNTESEDKVEEAKKQQAESSESEPKMMAATDSTDTKAAVEGKS